MACLPDLILILPKKEKNPYFKIFSNECKKKKKSHLLLLNRFAHDAVGCPVPSLACDRAVVRLLAL